MEQAHGPVKLENGGLATGPGPWGGPRTWTRSTVHKTGGGSRGVGGETNTVGRAAKYQGGK